MSKQPRRLRSDEISERSAQRFHASYERSGGDSACHIWKGRIQQDGYAKFCFDGQIHQAHRVAYALHYGEAPLGLTIDHTCNQRACVNPRHLEAVPLKTNVARATQTSSGVIRTTGKCRRGHDMTLDDAWRYSKTTGKRYCRLCHLERNREGMRKRYQPARKGE